MAPAFLVDGVQRPARNVAGVVDQDVGVAPRLGQRRELRRIANVGGNGAGLDLVRRAKPLAKRLPPPAAAPRHAPPGSGGSPPPRTPRPPRRRCPSRRR